MLHAVLLWAVAAVAAQQSPLDRVAWLQGCWRSTSGQVTIDEQWMAPGGGTMLGISRTVRGGVTADHEFLLVTVQDGRLAYRAQPAGQVPVTFLAAESAGEQIVFENPEHDFPQRIGYRRVEADRAEAWIEGTVNGKPRRVEFSFRRVSCDAP